MQPKSLTWRQMGAWPLPSRCHLTGRQQVNSLPAWRPTSQLNRTVVSSGGWFSTAPFYMGFFNTTVKKKINRHPAGVCRTQASPDQHGSTSSDGGGKKVEVIDLTLDSSSDDEGQESSSPAPASAPAPPPLPPPPAVLPPPAKRACPSMSPTSPPIINKGSEPL